MPLRVLIARSSRRMDSCPSISYSVRLLNRCIRLWTPSEYSEFGQNNETDNPCDHRRICVDLLDFMG